MQREYAKYDKSPEAKAWAAVAFGAYEDGKKEAGKGQKGWTTQPWTPPAGTYSDEDNVFFAYCYETGYEVEITPDNSEVKHNFWLEFDECIRGGLDDGIARRPDVERMPVTGEKWAKPYADRLDKIFAYAYQTGLVIADKGSVPVDPNKTTPTPSKPADDGSNWVAWGIVGALVGVAAGAVVMLAKAPKEAWR